MTQNYVRSVTLSLERCLISLLCGVSSLSRSRYIALGTVQIPPRILRGTPWRRCVMDVNILDSVSKEEKDGLILLLQTLNGERKD